jgi:hypothetical protein
MIVQNLFLAFVGVESQMWTQTMTECPTATIVVLQTAKRLILASVGAIIWKLTQTGMKLPTAMTCAPRIPTSPLQEHVGATTSTTIQMETERQIVLMHVSTIPLNFWMQRLVDVGSVKQTRMGIKLKIVLTSVPMIQTRAALNSAAVAYLTVTAIMTELRTAKMDAPLTQINPVWEFVVAVFSM